TRPGATSWRGQERSTGGILRGVAVRESSGIDLTDLVVTPLDVSEDSARLVIEGHVRNWTDRAQKTTLEGVIRPKNFADARTFAIHAALVAPPGTSRVRTEIRIDKPQLWWSWDYGKPNLYELSADLTGAAPLDHRAVSFGIRSITRDE